jgi:hypothetical protein
MDTGVSPQRPVLTRGMKPRRLAVRFLKTPCSSVEGRAIFQFEEYETAAKSKLTKSQ